MQKEQHIILSFMVAVALLLTACGEGHADDNVMTRQELQDKCEKLTEADD